MKALKQNKKSLTKGKRPLAAVYYRCGSHLQADGQKDNQFKALKKYAATHGFRISSQHQYFDMGSSQGPAFTQLFQDALEGKFKTIVASNPSRLSRSLPHFQDLASRLGRSNVKIMFVQNPNLDLNKNKIKALETQIQKTIGALKNLNFDDFKLECAADVDGSKAKTPDIEKLEIIFEDVYICLKELLRLRRTNGE